MFKKILYLIMSLMVVIGLQSCDENDTIVGGGIIPEPDLVGCEATNFYDWGDFTFSTSLDGGATTWLGFEFDETTLFSINLNQAGFHCVIFDGCDGEYGSPPPIYDFQTNGNDVEVGIVTPGSYYLEVTNTRPNRLDFTFNIALNDIVYGCMDDDALNYEENANVNDGSCEFIDCNTDYWVDAYQDWSSNLYGEMVNDCDGNCAPISWIGDTWCDTGDWGIYNPEGEVVGINLWCLEFDWDGGDCEAIIEECPEGTIEDCNGVCAPADWLGDGFCDDGSYEFNGNLIFFNCEEFNNDEGDCDGGFNRQQNQQRQYPNGRTPIGQ
jgi:hypothetical protein